MLINSCAVFYFNGYVLQLHNIVTCALIKLLRQFNECDINVCLGFISFNITSKYDIVALGIFYI